MTAKLQTLSTGVDPQAFYDLVNHPTGDAPRRLPVALEASRTARASKGFLYPATYSVVTSANGGRVQVTDADALIRMMLDKFYDAVGDVRMAVPESRGLTFYQILALASIVEREAVVDEERPLIAGVYQNRLDGKRGSKTDPQRGPDGACTPTTRWRSRRCRSRSGPNYFFWSVPRAAAAGSRSRRPCRATRRTRAAASSPGPICTPSVASIDAALEPDTAAGYCTSWRSRTAAARTPSPRRSPSTTRTTKKYGYRVTTDRAAVRLAAPRRLRGAADARRLERWRDADRRRARSGWPACGSGWWRDGRRRLLRRPLRAHALPDRASRSPRPRRPRPAIPASSW